MPKGSPIYPHSSSRALCPGSRGRLSETLPWWRRYCDFFVRAGVRGELEPRHKARDDRLSICLVAFFLSATPVNAESLTFCASGNDYVVVRTQIASAGRCVKLAEKVEMCRGDSRAYLSIRDDDVNTRDTIEVDSVRIVFDREANELIEVVFFTAPRGLLLKYRDGVLVEIYGARVPPCAGDEMLPAATLLDASNEKSAAWQNMQRRLQR